jgi:glutamate/tyrosine decarboxylase-like PLP-dependent enzyme
MDGYFVHTISRFLDRLDALKSSVPVLGSPKKSDYQESLCSRSPESTCSLEDVKGLLAGYCEGTPIWSHPNSQVNVVPPPSIPSLMGFLAAAIFNPNIISDEYSGRFSAAEIEVVAILSEMIGFDPNRSGGLFTFGGTGTNLYGCKLGIEKLFRGRAMQDGIREDVKIVTSEAAHYSRLNIAAWLGLGTNNLVTVPAGRNNDISIADLEESLRSTIEAGNRVAVIMPTMGTTDAFGIDDIASVVALRDSLVSEYGLDYHPHIHADAVIGWSWTVFRDYDFHANPLGFRDRTLRSIRESLVRIKDIHLADSVGIDFHKTGYTPYISSVFIAKDRGDLTLLSRHPEQMPYLYEFGRYTPGIYTLECSRSATGALAALANLRLFGKEGYRVLIGHHVEMAEMLRDRLEAHPFVKVLNDYNYGPVTLFRLYPDGKGTDVFERELTDPGYRETVEKHNDYNRRIFAIMYEQAMRGEGVLLSWTAAYRHADYPGGPRLSALKSYIMSPWTDEKAIETVVSQITEARKSQHDA